jgi:hypothetical protein
MRGNTCRLSSPCSLACENVADLVDSLGEAYTVYRRMEPYSSDCAIVEDEELSSFLVELKVTLGDSID